MSINIKKICAAAAVSATALASVPAAASVLVLNYQTTSTFIQAAAPVRSLVLNFTVTYDPLVTYNNVAVSNYMSSSTAAQFNSLPIVFSNTPGIAGGNLLIIGGGTNGTAYLEGSNDFFVQLIVDGNGNPIGSRSDTVEYSVQGQRITYNAPRPQVTATAVSGAVPEPATWAMLLVGFGMIGAATRHRKLAKAQ